MPNISMLIKPASSLCNLRCRYCFYSDESEKREVASYGIMSYETLDVIVRRAVSESSGKITFSFQGGEPTLAGIEYYEYLHNTVEKYKTELGKPNIRCSYSIQTNGILVGENERWAQLFKKHGYLVGLSVDGTKNIHDANRIDSTGHGTYSRVCAAADILRRNSVDFNILTVVNAYTARHISRIYSEYKKRGWNYIQFIPCLDPIGEKPFSQETSLTPERYLAYSQTAFDLWYTDNYDYMSGRTAERMSIRRFDNLLQIALGQRPESCGMNGICSVQFVIEANGGVYPCDFYVFDDYQMGSILDSSFAQLYEGARAQKFIGSSLVRNPKCAQCRQYPLCGGGCSRYRNNGEYIYCDAEFRFAEYIRPRLMRLAEIYRTSIK